MKDRTPTQVLPNGAIRYEEFNESEVSQGYKYLKLADEPTEVGTALNKAFGDESFFVTYVHARTGSNNELTNADGGDNIRFIVTADTDGADTWTVNGTSYTLKDQSGETYEAELKAGAIVSCFADNTNHVLNFKTGGAALNFKVVGGTSQPASPAENTVWVNTDTAITEWVFSSERPTAKLDGTALSGGEVWIRCGTSATAPLNALKKNGVFEYPNACFQYVEGVWTIKTAKTYQNGAWVSWDTPIWIDGYHNTDLTGGFVGGYTMFNQYLYQGTAGKIIFGEDNLEWRLGGVSGQCGYFHMSNLKINTANYSQLKFVVANNGATNSKGVGLLTGSPNNNRYYDYIAASVIVEAGFNGEKTIDLSSLNDSYHLGFSGYHNGAGASIYLSFSSIMLIP